MKREYIIPNTEAIYCAPSSLAAGSETSHGSNPDGKDHDSGTSGGFTPDPNEAKRNPFSWQTVGNSSWDQLSDKFE